MAAGDAIVHTHAARAPTILMSSRLVRPMLSEDQVRALLELAQDHLLETAMAPSTERRACVRTQTLLTGAIVKLQEALGGT